MSRIAGCMAVGLMACLAAVPGYTHHSFAATYFVDQEVTINGTLIQLLYRNPHSFMQVAVPDANGQVTTWSIEWGGGAQLAQDNVSRDTLKPGDKLVITGNPGRNADDHRIRLHKVVRPSDGWKWEGVIM